jgi:hypothetical protein
MKAIEAPEVTSKRRMASGERRSANPRSGGRDDDRYRHLKELADKLPEDDGSQRIREKGGKALRL